MGAKHFRVEGSQTTGGWAAYHDDQERGPRAPAPAHMAAGPAVPAAAEGQAGPHRAPAHARAVPAAELEQLEERETASVQRPASSAAAVHALREERRRSHSKAPLIGGIVGGAVVVALGLGYAVGVRGCWHPLDGQSGVVSGEGQAQDQQQEAQSQDSASAQGQDATQTGDAEASVQDEEESQAQVTDASGVLALLSSLQHVGTDCSLPTDGTEVDVLGGRVLVAYQTDENADATLTRMTAAQAALLDALKSLQLTDSSTTSDGVSQVPAASTPGAIASGGSPVACSGVELVVLGSGGYVVAASYVPAGSDLANADEAAVLDAADSYAVDGGAYAYSGLAAKGIAQSKGDAPTLLTGEAITIRLTRARATSTSASSTTSSSTSTRSTTSGSRSTPGSTATTSTGYSGYGTSGSTGYSGTSGTSSGTGYGTGYTSGTYDSYGSYDSYGGDSAADDGSGGSDYGDGDSQ